MRRLAFALLAGTSAYGHLAKTRKAELVQMTMVGGNLVYKKD
jgi:hypothetical protein